MIEVNLHPYEKKRRSSGGPSFSIAPIVAAIRGGKLPADPYKLFAGAAGVVSLGLIGWMFLGLRSDRAEVDVRLQEELADNQRFQDIIQRNNQLLARRDSIAQRVSIIQEIDVGRFIGAHVMDEVANALPDFTWLTELFWVQDEPTQYRLSGSAGQTYAVTEFMDRLEASRFLRDVQLEGMNQATSTANPDDIVYIFTLLMTYEAPPLEELETIPLFEPSLAQASVADTTGGN